MNLFPSSGLFAAFVAASVLLALTPGPDMALYLSRTFVGGRSHGFAALVGAMNGIVVHTFAAALGLSALIAASARAYDAVKIAGALFLLYLAWGALKRGAEARG
jgi:threonine/homoserine/homoserine lactone efflux protein